MSETQTLDQSVHKEFELVTYKDLTTEELKKSNYPDSKFGGIFMDSINGDTGYEYSIGFVVKHPHGPYLKIDTEKRKDFLKKGSEKEAETALKEVAFDMRAKTGGYFEIHPFYGAVWGTENNPIVPNFCAPHRKDDDLATIIYINDNGKFDSSITRDSVAMGTTILLTSKSCKKLDDLREQEKRLGNYNQSNRDQAIANGLGKQWDAEFEKYNPQAKKRGLLGKISGKEKETINIPSAIDVTQKNVADFMDYLQKELGFRDLRVTQTNYKGLNLVEFKASTLPREKVSGLFDKDYNRIQLE